MKRIVIFLFIVFSLQTAFSQEFEMIRHQVKMGETVRMLSKKYKVEPSEIYRLNKFAVDGISQGMVLQIMVPKKDAPAEEVAQTEPAAETSGSVNPEQSNADETVTSSSTTTTKTTVVKKKKSTTDDTSAGETPREEPSVVTSTSTESSTSTATHTVAKGETLFSISRRYNVSVDEIKSQNPALQKKGLQPGQVLTITSNGGANIVEKVPDNVNQSNAATPENNVPSNNDNAGQDVRHTVVKGETLYSLSRKYNVSVEAIQMQNEQALKNGLKVGQVLVIGISK